MSENVKSVEQKSIPIQELEQTFFRASLYDDRYSSNSYKCFKAQQPGEMY